MKHLFSGIIVLLAFAVSISPANANWFGNNNRWGSGWGNNTDCNDWPEWTPMYWMEKMFDDKPECDDLRRTYYGGSSYQARYPAVGAGLYGRSPYGLNRYSPYPYSAGGRLYPAYPGRIGRYGSAVPPFFYNRFATTGVPFGGANRFGSPLSSPFSSPFSSSLSSPYNSFGAMPGMGSPSGFSASPVLPFASPMAYGSPMGGLGGMPGLSPMSSTWSMGAPMSGLGLPGMSPMSPYSSLSPFGGGLGGFSSPFSSPFSSVSPWSVGSPMGIPGGGLGGFGAIPFRRF